MLRLIVRKAAERDLNAILEYVARESGSVPIARAYVDRLRARYQKLADLGGEVGTRRDELRPGLRSVSEGRYLIFFRYAPGTLTIIRIVHAARNHRIMFPRP